mgnify:CR=1 FL=1
MEASADYIDAIEKVVRDHIRSGRIDDVRIRREMDYDGDDRVIVDVIFESKSNRLDPKETVEIARLVWQRMVDLDVPGFPSITFISKSDLGRSAAA